MDLTAIIDTKPDSSTKLQGPKLTEHIKMRWEEVHSNTSVFRYKIDTIEERIVDNKYLLQLNPNRKRKRRTPEQIEDICQQFDKNKFNFNKISKEEVMFRLKGDNDGDNNILVVNVSPISRYHTLLCPLVDQCLPQVVTRHSLKLVIDLMLIAEDRDLRIVYNSLCALASVNHLHYHLLFEKNDLPVETAICKHIKGSLYRFEDYPAPAFCFEITKESQKIDEIYKLIELLLRKCIAHNVVITRGRCLERERLKESFLYGEMSYRFVVWPRRSSSGAKQLEAFNVAACELSGWFPVHSSEDFHNLQADQLENELKKWRIDNFEELCEEVKLLY